MERRLRCVAKGFNIVHGEYWGWELSTAINIYEDRRNEVYINMLFCTSKHP